MDDLIKQIQGMLTERGYDLGPNPIDGKAGVKTMNAILFELLKNPADDEDDSLNAQLTKQLRRDEGEKLYAYQDHLGYWTIGVGRLIDKRKGGGISPEESAYLLSNNIAEVGRQLTSRLPWSVGLDDARLGVLMNMAFQMGINGLLGFKNTLAMIQVGDYENAAAGMLNSLWAKQTPERAQRLSKQMETGQWR